MKSACAVLVILASLTPAVWGANEIPPQTPLCKSTRATGLTKTDKSLLLPEIKLTKKEWDRVLKERTCLQGYGIGYPGGVDALKKARSSDIKADLTHFASLFEKAKTTTLRDTELQSAMMELIPQKDNAVQKLSAANRDTLRIHDIKEGLSREQALLWGNHLYLHRLFAEGEYGKLLREVADLRTQFKMEVMPIKRLDEAETDTYFTIQSLKNMIAILEFKAQAKLSAGDGAAAKKVLTNFVAKRNALVPVFGLIGGDPTPEIRRPFCSLKSLKG